MLGLLAWPQVAQGAARGTFQTSRFNVTTLDTLSALYRNVQRMAPSAALPSDAAAQLKIMADGIDAARDGQVGLGWTLNSALAQIIDTARATTSVASMTYGFITDTSLTAAGLTYLVSPTGGNPNNLNSDYYKGFSLENRYINFAVNLATVGEGKVDFAAEYGDGSIFEAFVHAYQKLFGVTKTLQDAFDILDADVPDGRGGVFTRGEYFATIGHDGGNGIGTKAAMVGWLLAEAVKAGVGPYAVANQNYLRGVQVSDASGLVSFSSIFPGCYSGRWPHIHFEVYPSLTLATSGSNDIRTSQLALPQASCSEVYNGDSRYSTSIRNLASITLASDNVFGNDSAANQLATVTGSLSAGYVATLTVGVSV